MLFIPRNAFQPGQNGFETGIIAAAYGNAPQGFHESCQQCCGFWSRFRKQRSHRPPAEVLRQLIGPKRFDDGREFVKSRRDGTPRCHIGKPELPCVIQHNIARFAARRIGTGLGELPEGLA